MKAKLDSLMVHVQTAYCHSSLGAKIIIERVGDYIYLDKKLPICGLHKLKEDTANYLGDADLMVYMVSVDIDTDAMSRPVGDFLNGLKSTVNLSR